jgi:hypothetical protein
MKIGDPYLELEVAEGHQLIDRALVLDHVIEEEMALTVAPGDFEEDIRDLLVEFAVDEALLDLLEALDADQGLDLVGQVLVEQFEHDAAVIKTGAEKEVVWVLDGLVFLSGFLFGCLSGSGLFGSGQNAHLVLNQVCLEYNIGKKVRMRNFVFANKKSMIAKECIKNLDPI